MQNNVNFIMALSDFRYDQPITDGERFFWRKWDFSIFCAVDYLVFLDVIGRK
ncbi:MAG: hypothetical protein GY820_34760 [Gammaproteobacteria bacterium]|nr:hypothetical protein [Gammaproteobacteria bacterium]